MIAYNGALQFSVEMHNLWLPSALIKDNPSEIILVYKISLVSLNLA